MEHSAAGVVYSEDTAGKDGYKSLLDQSSRAGVCITTEIAVPSGLQDSEYQVQLKGK